jgi:outer membrane protein TolC
VWLVFLTGLSAHAQQARVPQPAADRVHVDQLVAEALAKNPEIGAAQNRVESMRQRPAQEGSRPDPMISAGYSSTGYPWPGAGLGTQPTSNIGFTVSQALPYPGKLDLRASLARRDADAELQQIDATRLSVTARVKQAFYRLAYTYAVADVLERNRELLQTLLKVSENRYAVGHAAQQDVIKAQTQLTIVDLQLARIRQERATREGELNALRAQPVGTPVGRPDDLVLTDFDLSLQSLVSSATAQAPMLKRDQIVVERAQLAVASARQEYKPDFTVSGGYFNMGSMSPMYEFRFDVTLPLRRARRDAAVAEQVSTVQETRQTYEANRLDLQSRIQQDYEMATTSLRLAQLYRDTVLPQARLALESSMASYQTGAVDFLSVLTNVSGVLDHETSYFEELAAYHVAVSRLEEMTGAPIVH